MGWMDPELRKFKAVFGSGINHSGSATLHKTKILSFFSNCLLIFIIKYKKAVLY